MEWHIWDFPDNIRVYFKDEFREALYKKLIEICKTRIEIARRLKSDKETIRRCLYLGYRKHKNGRKVKTYTSVPLIKKIVEIFGSKLGEDFIQNFDKSVIAYRSWNGWNVINPILPIKETPRLYSIVFHLIGDGNASIRHSPFYSNKCEELIKEFTQNLQILGRIETKDKPRENGVIVVYFPKAITDILKQIFQVKLTKPECLPERVFKSSLKCKTSAIRSFVDDEGCVSGSFSITQKSGNLLKQFKKLLKSIGIKTGKICEENGVHKIYVFSEHHEKYLKMIGFTNPRKKKTLEESIRKRKIRKERIRADQKQYKILELLNENYPLTKHEIACSLRLTSYSALDTLLNLKEKGKVIGKPVGKNKPYLWYPKV